MADSGQRALTRVAIIGTGFGGLGMAHYLKKAGIDSFVIFEKAQDVGGTWRENTYPGAGCDVPSHLYSFSFEPHYRWACRYAKQSEILDYLRHCAGKYDLSSHIRFGCEVTGASFDAARSLWVVQLASGETYEAEFLVSAVGQLHRPAYPRFPGLERFQGRSFHSAAWDHDYDLDGKTVAVIGTGASAVQFVPEIAGRVARLHVFQRSPGWVAPKFERKFSAFERWLLDALPLLHDLDRLRVFCLTESLAYAYRGNPLALGLVTLLAKAQLRLQVRDPALRRKLTPDYPVGCKRILLTVDWLRTLTLPNVEVVSEDIERLTAEGIRTSDGRLRPVDAIIYGTGFAATEFLAPMQIRGMGGVALEERWKDGAEAYLGMSVPGFPNFFTLYGPNTNVGSGSAVYMLECQQRYVVAMLQAQRQQGWRQAEVRPEAAMDFGRWLQAQSAKSTFEGNCQSWYKTADGRNTNNWVGSMLDYARRTARPELAHYRLTAATSAAAVVTAGP